MNPRDDLQSCGNINPTISYVSIGGGRCERKIKWKWEYYLKNEKFWGWCLDLGQSYQKDEGVKEQDEGRSEREVLDNKALYRYVNGQRVLYTINKGFEYIKPLKPAKTFSNNIITIDLETRTIDNIITPYCVSLYDGKKAWSYYLTDFNDVDSMLMTAIKSLLRDKYNNYSVYAHNLSGFDGIFLINIIAEFG